MDNIENKKACSCAPSKVSTTSSQYFHNNGINMNFNSNSFNGNKKTYARFLITINGVKKEIGLCGQNARTLLALARFKNGITTYEGFGLGLPRLSGYVCDLRHDFNINIITVREEHGDGKWHGRYILIDIVEVGKVFKD